MTSGFLRLILQGQKVYSGKLASSLELDNSPGIQLNRAEEQFISIRERQSSLVNWTIPHDLGAVERDMKRDSRLSAYKFERVCRVLVLFSLGFSFVRTIVIDISEGWNLIIKSWI